MALDEKKILPPPPLNAPITDNTNRFVLAWSSWFRSIYDTVTLNSLNLSNMRAVSLSFTGQSTNGYVTPISMFNVDTIERVNVGEYNITVKQNKFFSKKIFIDFHHIVSFNIEPITSTGLFTVDVINQTLNGFTLKIYKHEILLTNINKVSYDPTNIDDIINIEIITNAGINRLPN